MKWKSLLVALFLIGCGQASEPIQACEGVKIEGQKNIFCILEPPYSVGWSKTSTEQDDKAVETAIALWNKAAGTTLFERGDELSAIRIAINPSSATEDEGYAEFFYEGGRPIGCFVTIKPGASWPLYAHELGHCAGFEHVDDPSSIMFPDTDVDQKVTPAMKKILADLFQ